MDISEGKEALQKIQELEKQIETHLDQMRREAKDIVSTARIKAEELVREKEKKLAALHKSLTGFSFIKKSEPQNTESSNIEIDQDLIQNLAEDFLKLLTRS